ncbi:MAG TPA: DUF3124 domain-containing protein [Syntrophorhabdaceae bacterium]|nr:DUF3124 domain-containing protein [Syntrophorhabdaceae bacterium]HOL04565.1 DUF3124 domain-containing protein [Syntrophorhabdaceae bacterium]HPP42203.1 DUF3124 domain-containing protein [Syntrophorhabdaceae bacterium]
MIYTKRFTKPIPVSLIVLSAIFFIAVNSFAQQDIRLSKGQTVYVPAYSHIYYGDREIPIYLAVTVSIRNIDQTNPITINEVNYYDTKGELLKKYLNTPMRLGVNASTRFIIKESDYKGGSGANFIVKWTSNAQVNPPIIESIMIGRRNQQAVSFTSRGQAIIDGGR